MPSSRPKPDCLKPPNGVDTRTERVRVDREHAGVERARDAQRARAVARPDRAREPVRRVVRDADRVRLVRRTGSPRRPGRRPPRGRRGRRSSPRRACTGTRSRGRPGASPWKSDVAVDEATRPSRGARPRSAAPSRSPRRSGSPTRTPRVALDEQLERSGRRPSARRGCASGRSSPGRRCRRRRTARRRRPAPGRRPRRRRSPTCRRARA